MAMYRIYLPIILLYFFRKKHQKYPGPRSNSKCSRTTHFCVDCVRGLHLLVGLGNRNHRTCSQIYGKAEQNSNNHRPQTHGFTGNWNSPPLEFLKVTLH